MSEIEVFMAVKTVVISSSETLVTTYKTTWCHNPEDHNPHKLCLFIIHSFFSSVITDTLVEKLGYHISYFSVSP
jgi:hypothetical protein